MPGWIAIYRDLLAHWLWSKKPFSYGQAWLDLLLRANYAPKQIILSGSPVTIERGQLHTSLAHLADAWGWTVKQVRGFLDLLTENDMIQVRSSKQGRTITIVNYEGYQMLGQSKTHAVSDSLPYPGQTKGKVEGKDRGKDRGKAKPARRLDSSNVWGKAEGKELGKAEGKDITKDKQDREGYAPPAQDQPARGNGFTPPTVDEIRSYMLERGYPDEAQLFVDFYAARGWKHSRGLSMQSWKAAVNVWQRRRTEHERSAGRPTIDLDEWIRGGGE